MPTLCRTYFDEGEARRAVAHMLAAGAQAQTIRLLTGSRLHDVRAERVGTFAGSVGPDAPVGTFANRRRRRGQGNGSYAGDPDRQRKGSFGDVDRDVIVTFERDAEHPRIATHRMLRRLLGAVTLDGEPADRLVDELHVGHGLVLADLAPSAAGERRGIAGRAARL
jgi:hypothetical protein